MSFRNRVILLGSLCGLLLATLLLGQLFSPQRNTGGGRILRDLKTETVGKIQLKAGSGEIVLVKRKDWVLQDSGRELPASAARVESLLKELSSLTRGSAITAREDAWAGLGLEGSDAKSLALFGGKGETLAELVVGKAGVGGGGSYVRANGEKQVYQTDTSLASFVETQRRYWSHLKLLPDGLKSQNATRISLQGKIGFEDGKKERTLGYALVKSADSKGKIHWIVEGRKDVVLDEQKVEQVVTSLLGCEGNDFAEAADGTKKAMAAIQAEVTLSMGDNREFTLIVGGKAEGSQYYAGLKGGELSYLVPEWRLERILVEERSLSSQSR